MGQESCGAALPQVRGYGSADVGAMVRIWNEVVEDGVAFPQEEPLDLESGAAFFAKQVHCGVAVGEGGEVLGLYILHPNNIGRCGHIANASYAVGRAARGKRAGRALVLDSLAQAKRARFRVMQFNAVVAENAGARHLYESIGFTQLGTIPGGFRMPDGTYADICPYYYDLAADPADASAGDRASDHAGALADSHTEDTAGVPAAEPGVRIVDGRGHLADVKELITEYVQRLGRDLSFQGLEDELADIEAKYAPPHGEVLVALDGDDVLGMVAYYRHTDERCEMKRLFVRPQARGRRLGDALVTAIVEHARDAGFKEMVLDTVTPLKAAIGLYGKHGFEECEPYYDNPFDDVIYMRKQLR